MNIIDADAFVKEILACVMYGNTSWVDKYEVLLRLRNSPTIDAVPVVRCRDCKHYWKNSKYEDDMDAVAMCLASPKDDAFCSEGERKEE